MKGVPVFEIMSKKPATAPPTIKVSEAASLMKKHGVGSLIIVKSKAPIGIVTERDILTKVVAQKLEPEEIMIKEIMSSPVVCVHPHMDINDAAKQMASLQIRRLPVVEDSILIGIVTEKDILKISPQLIEIIQEYARISRYVDRIEEKISGYCENCKAFSDQLNDVDGELLCRRCTEAKK